MSSNSTPALPVTFWPQDEEHARAFLASGPPSLLFHGTTLNRARLISTEGLATGDLVSSIQDLCQRVGIEFDRLMEEAWIASYVRQYIGSRSGGLSVTRSFGNAVGYAAAAPEWQLTMLEMCIAPLMLELPEKHQRTNEQWRQLRRFVDRHREPFSPAVVGFRTPARLAGEPSRGLWEERSATEERLTAEEVSPGTAVAIFEVSSCFTDCPSQTGVRRCPCSMVAEAGAV